MSKVERRKLHQLLYHRLPIYYDDLILVCLPFQHYRAMLSRLHERGAYFSQFTIDSQPINLQLYASIESSENRKKPTNLGGLRLGRNSLASCEIQFDSSKLDLRNFRAYETNKQKKHQQRLFFSAG